MIVDCHAHLVPPDLLAAIRKDAAQFRQRAADRGWRSAWPSPLPAASRRGRCPSRYRDIPARLAWMDKQGIDKQVVGGWVDMFGYELPGAEAEAWSRLANERLRAAAKAEPRFVPLATVPLDDGARAATVLKDAMTAGFAGCMIGTLPRGVGQRARRRRSRPVLAGGRRNRRGHPHPSKLRCRRRARERFRPRQRARPHHRRDGGRGTADLRWPCHALQKCQILRADGRRRPALRARPAQAQCTQSHPASATRCEALSLIYTDTILHDARVLRFVVEMIGADRLMLGSDMPFPIGDLEPMKIVAEAGFSKAQTRFDQRRVGGPVIRNSMTRPRTKGPKQ